MSRRILIVDDEADFAAGLSRQIAAHLSEVDISLATSAEGALELLAADDIDLMLTDLRMPGMSGFDLALQALEQCPGLSIVMMTAYGTIETAVNALKKGVYDFITKPVERSQLLRVVDKGLERSRLLQENRVLKRMVEGAGSGGSLVGNSKAMRLLKQSIAAIAASDYTVLVRGESGTGKELVAQTIHKLSPRRDKPMVAVNCPAIPDQLLESELFGHKKGAFTGADKDRQGLFVAANRGSIHLDEIGDISKNIQTKLLRCVQEQEIRPVGANISRKVDVRIIASTNQDLEARIKQHEFREDLFYRLNVLTVQVPPLRERKEDIPLLAMHFLKTIRAEINLNPIELNPEALAYLASRDWPGNVRELLNFVRRLGVFCSGDSVDMGVVRLVESQSCPASNPDCSELAPYMEAKTKVMDDFSSSYVQALLAQTGGNISEAARLSGLERVSLQKILKRLEISAADYR